MTRKGGAAEGGFFLSRQIALDGPFYPFILIAFKKRSERLDITYVTLPISIDPSVSMDNDEDSDDNGVTNDHDESFACGIMVPSRGGSATAIRPSQVDHRLPVALVPTTHVRVAIIGDTRCGKTTIMRRCRDRLLGRKSTRDTLNQPTAESAASAPYESLSVAIVPPEGERDGQEVVFIELRDPRRLVMQKTYGYEYEERDSYDTPTEVALFRDVNVLLCVVDLTRRESLQACHDWIHRSARLVPPGMNRTALFVGNGKQMHDVRQITQEAALRAASRHRVGYLEVDALGSDDDIDELLKKLAQASLRLHRYEENIRLIGLRSCPRDCPEGERGRPHRHLFREGSIEWRLEYVDSSTTVWGPRSNVVSDDSQRQIEPVRQPFPSVQRSWLRIMMPPMPPEEPKQLRSMGISHGPSMQQEHIDERLLINKLVKNFDQSARQVPTNRYTRPQSGSSSDEFTEQTRLLTWWPAPGVVVQPRCFVSLFGNLFLGCFRGSDNSKTTT